MIIKFILIKIVNKIINHLKILKIPLIYCLKKQNNKISLNQIKQNK